MISLTAFFNRTIKIKTALQLRCESCFLTKREGRLFVKCKIHPRHKQRQGRAKIDRLHYK